MKKKIVFLDGDGTLWYPKSTKRNKVPHWIYPTGVYAGDKAMGAILRKMQLIPGTLVALKKLRNKGVKLVIVSTHPYTPAISKRALAQKVAHFELGSLFDEWHHSSLHPNGKAKIFKTRLKKYGIKKSEALHVGDSYTYDYKAARYAGIDVLLFDVPYLKERPKNKKLFIKKLSDVLRFV